MRRVAGCLVVSLLASAAAWVGCRTDLDEQSQGLIASDAMGGDAYGGGTAGSDAGISLDTIAVLDTIMVTDGSGEGGMTDGSGSDDGGTGGGSDDGGGGAGGDGGGTGNPLRPGEGDGLDRTSFYACAGGPASAGLEVGLPIGVALVLAVRRRRRFRRPG
jgi:hypothetical protein